MAEYKRPDSQVLVKMIRRFLEAQRRADKKAQRDQPSKGPKHQARKERKQANRFVGKQKPCSRNPGETRQTFW
jgi:hypothetical protein